MERFKRQLQEVRDHPVRASLMSCLMVLVGLLFALPFTGAMAGPLIQLRQTPTPTPSGQQEVREIRVLARSFEFVPSSIEIEAGQSVKFIVHSADIFHTFSVKQRPDATQDIFSLALSGGQTDTYTFVPQQTGTLYLYCKPHEALGMTGQIHVQQ